MKCMNCYQEISDSCKFCPNCGAKQPVQKMEPVSQVKEETTDNITEDTAEVTDLLMEELKMAAANYPRRKFTDEEENQNRKTEKRASERKRELEEQGFRINIFREEPFIASRDSLQYKISLMIWEKKGKKRKVQIEEFSADRRG